MRSDCHWKVVEQAHFFACGMKRGLSVMAGLVLLATLALTGNSSAQTNALGGGGRISLSFSNAPIVALEEFLPKVTGKPLLACLDVSATFSYATNGLSREATLRVLGNWLQARYLCLTNINGAYLKLLPLKLANQADFGAPHVEIEIRKDSITVDGQAVVREDVADAVRKSAAPESEVWIFDGTDSLDQALPPNWNVPSVAADVSAQARIPRSRIYREFRPR
jgi:hypothetical protein